jgi:hypothetical protein
MFVFIVLNWSLKLSPNLSAIAQAIIKNKNINLTYVSRVDQNYYLEVFT